MLPSTLIGLLGVVIAVLPGSVYTWAYERQASAYGVTFADRTLRFIAVSVVFHVGLGWPEYALYRLSIAHRHDLLAGQFALLWVGLVFLVAIPASAGTILGGLYATRTNRNKWTRLRRRLSAAQEALLLRILLGRDPAPRAWDNLFSERPTVYMRVKTTDQTWIAGLSRIVPTPEDFRTTRICSWKRLGRLTTKGSLAIAGSDMLFMCRRARSK